MNAVPSRAIMEEVAQLRGISEAFVEKDWYVTQVIDLMQGISFGDFTLVFTGGTALSKAHGLIQRFSEDIDFRVLSPSLASRTKSQQSKSLSSFKHAVVGSLQAHFTIEPRQVFARNGNRFFAIELTYPTLFGRLDALRPHLLLELTVSELALPALSRPVSSFINEAAKKRPEVAAIDCIDPVENAADKLSAITWRIPDRVRGALDDDPAIVRHLHDLAILSGSALDHPDFARLVRLTLDRDDKRSEAVAGLSLTQKFANVISLLKTDAAYAAEYERFVQGMSYAPSHSVPSFQLAVDRVGHLIDSIMDSLP